jgi:hypothetical protein
MFDKLKSYDIDRASVDELIALAALAAAMIAEYQTNQLGAPEWVTTRLKSIRREIKTRVQDQLEAKLAEAKARRESLRTTEEKRTVLDAEIAALTAQLQS